MSPAWNNIPPWLVRGMASCETTAWRDSELFCKDKSGPLRFARERPFSCRGFAFPIVFCEQFAGPKRNQHAQRHNT